MLKIVYALFVGILLSVFVGVGISTFYPEPAFPTTKPAFQLSNSDPDSNEYKLNEAIYTTAQEQYRKDISTYYRNVSIIGLVAAVIFVTAGLAFASRLRILADGLLVGGIFTLLYSIARGFMNDENIFRFSIVSAGLVIALAIGYIKFIRPEQKTPAKKK